MFNKINKWINRKEKESKNNLIQTGRKQIYFLVDLGWTLEDAINKTIEMSGGKLTEDELTRVKFIFKSSTVIEK